MIFFFQKVSLYVASPPELTNHSASEVQHNIEGGGMQCKWFVSMLALTPASRCYCAPRQVSVLRGGSALLVCRAAGEPAPVITWRRADGRMINVQHRGGQPEHRGPVLPLGELSPRDTGDYQCVAR